MTTSPPSRPRALGTPLLLTLALLAATTPFGTDLYLPAFPEMVTGLSTTETGVQLSLTAFLIGAGAGQVLFGPLSDRFGRQRPLVAGALVFVAASVAASLAPTLPLLVAARLVQGLAGAAGMVIGRAVIADTAHGIEAARAMSLMMLVSGVAPIIAPIAGSVLAEPLGWRGLLWIVTAVGAVAAVAVLIAVPETRTPAAEKSERSLGSRGVIRKLGSRAYVGGALAFAFGFSTMMAYISASPFLYQDLMGLSTVAYGLAFAINALALVGVSVLSRNLAYRIDAVVQLRVGLGINAGAIVVLAALAFGDVPPLWLALPILVTVGSLGLVLGNATATALDAVPEAPGLGSAFLGLAQFALAGIISPLVSIGGGTTAIPLALTMLGATLVANAGAALVPRARR